MKKINLVCIHGNSLNSSIFEKLNLPQLNKILINLPGHNNESIDDIDNFLAIVDSVKTKIENLDNVILFGYSLGGHIAHHLLDKLNNIKGIISVAAPPISLETAHEAFLPNPNVALLFKENLTENDIQLLAEEMTNNSQQKNTISKLISLANPKIRTILGLSLGQGQFENEILKLKKFQGPKVFIHPEYDKFINGNYIQNLQLGDFYSIPNSHMAILENNSFFEDIINKTASRL